MIRSALASALLCAIAGAYAGGQDLKFAYNFRAGADAAMKALACQETLRDLTLDIPGGEERFVDGRRCINGMNAGGRFVKYGNRNYSVIFLVMPSGNLAQASHFLQSFKLIPVAN